jgi:type I restriction enzyme R subunit
VRGKPTSRRYSPEEKQYFCATEPGNAEQLKENEPKRVELYKAVAAVTRAFANLANDMNAAGFSDAEVEAIRNEIDHYVAVRAEVKPGAGEDVDFKQYRPGCASCSIPISTPVHPRWCQTSRMPA